MEGKDTGESVIPHEANQITSSLEACFGSLSKETRGSYPRLPVPTPSKTKPPKPLTSLGALRRKAACLAQSVGVQSRPIGQSNYPSLSFTSFRKSEPMFSSLKPCIQTFLTLLCQKKEEIEKNKRSLLEKCIERTSTATVTSSASPSRNVWRLL